MASRSYGFVPARGGSVGIPDKNLRRIGGKPLAVRAIDTLLRVPELTSVILSTDSEEIAALGREAGAEVPFLRPPELATAEAPVLGALRHALDHLEREGRAAEWVVMVQPTSPFVRPETAAAVLAYARTHDLPLVQTVSPVKEHPYWVRVLAGDRMYPFHPAFGSLRRQDLPRLVVLNGAVNVYRARAVVENDLPQLPGFFLIDRVEGFDVDDELDLTIAELLAASLAAEPVAESSDVPH